MGGLFEIIVLLLCNGLVYGLLGISYTWYKALQPASSMRRAAEQSVSRTMINFGIFQRQTETKKAYKEQRTVHVAAHKRDGDPVGSYTRNKPTGTARKAKGKR